MNRAAKVILILFVLFVLALGGALYFFWQYKKAQTMPTDGTGNVATVEEVAQTVALVAQHALLPDGETPTVATITDVESLAGQEFFKNAKVGYKVLVYPEARVAILYDPVIDRVVNMAQINPADEAGGVPQDALQDDGAGAPENSEESTGSGDETVVQ